jgi:hypothetical protein
MLTSPAGTLRVILLCALAATLLAAPGQAEEPLTIENSELRVSVSARTGTLLGVYHKRRDVSYLEQPAQPGWFRIQLPLPYWEGHTVDSESFHSLRVRKIAADSMVIEASEAFSTEGEYPVRVTLILRLESDNLVGKLRVTNHSRQTIDRLVFPAVQAPEAADSAEILLTPNSSLPLRSLFSDNVSATGHNPFETLDPLSAKAWFQADPRIPAKAINYPMVLPTAWVTFVGDAKGIGFDVRAQDFQFQKFIIERRLFRDAREIEANRRDYTLSWNWYPLVRPGESWSSPEVYLKFDGGNWKEIARQHREWLDTWIRRPAVAPELQSSIGWISRSVRSFDQIPEIARQGVEVGAPYFILYGWSQISPAGMAYDNYPRTELGGVEALRQNLQAARELGSYPLAWFNGTLTVESNPGHLLKGKHWVAIDRWGGEVLGGRWSLYEPFQIVTTPNSAPWIEFDPSTGAREFLLETVRRFIEQYHFSGFHMDLGNKNFLSYRPENRRPELAFSEGYADFYARAQQIVKGADPNGIITGENYSEMMSQYVDSNWLFEGGVLNVPVLSRLRYSQPWVRVPARAVVTDRGHASRAFVMNAPLDIFNDLTGHPEYARHLQQLHALKRTAVHYFYEADFSDDEGFTLEAEGGAEGLLGKSYRQAGGGFLAVVIANSGDAAAQAVLRPAAGLPVARVRHHFLGGRVEERAPPGERGMTLGLAPYDVQIISFEAK